MTRQEAGKDLSAVGHHLVVEVSFEMSFVKNGDHANIITTIIFMVRDPNNYLLCWVCNYILNRQTIKGLSDDFIEMSNIQLLLLEKLVR